MMRKLAIAVFAVAAAATVAAAPAQAQRWHGHGGWHGGHRGGWGWGAGAGFAAGALLGGALAAAPRYYYSEPGYAYGPGPAYVDEDDSVAYCSQRYRSYDPASGTFLGYDGYRHPCP
ncbi:BA14K family protein [Microbacteriaceae bacterium K1510]|nr:BA14K family protein [Microbacteriaceae bacterium K1510]